MRVAVVYYSLTGTTAEVADAIAAALDVTPIEITEPRPREGLGGALRSIWETLAGSSTRIDPPAIDPGQFDLIFVGGPMWVARPCAPLQTFLRALQSQSTPLAFFITMGDSKPHKTLARMAELSGRQPVASLALTAQSVADGIDNSRLQDFIAEAIGDLLTDQAA